MRIRELIQPSSAIYLPEADTAAFELRCQAILSKLASLADPTDQATIQAIDIWITSDPAAADKIYSSPKDRVVVVDQEEFATAPVSVLIWLIAHEVGHIVMNHRDKIAPQQSQQQELDADDYASKLALKLGINKVPVFTWLGRRKDQLGRTELERRLQAERDPSLKDFWKDRSHPTTDQRQQRAQQQGMELSKANTDQIDQLLKHMA